MSANRAKNSKPELRVRGVLAAKGIKGYKLNWGNLPGRPDIVFPEDRIAIFVNGCFWHRCPYCRPSVPKTNKKFWNNKFLANKKRDRRVRQRLTRNGWKVFVFWECQIKKDTQQLVDKVSAHMFKPDDRQ
jgi:DNA mismatch endonuclease (patch repair protein)